MTYYTQPLIKDQPWYFFTYIMQLSPKFIPLGRAILFMLILVSDPLKYLKNRFPKYQTNGKSIVARIAPYFFGEPGSGNHDRSDPLDVSYRPLIQDKFLNGNCLLTDAGFNTVFLFLMRSPQTFFSQTPCATFQRIPSQSDTQSLQFKLQSDAVKHALQHMCYCCSVSWTVNLVSTSGN